MLAETPPTDSSFGPPEDALSWWLPGHGEAKPDCGTFVYLGHLISAGSEIAHYRRVHRRCGRFRCPTCALAESGWAQREAGCITDRVRAGCSIARRRPIHVVVSPLPTSPFGTIGDYLRLRRRMYAVAKACGFRGGCAIFHHKRLGSRRFNGRALGCRNGPHFHLIGDGWIRPAVCRACAAFDLDEADRIEAGMPPGHYPYVSGRWDKIPSVRVQLPDGLWADQEKHDPECGWVVKNLGVRKSVRATAFYILSHASQGILPTPDLRGPEVVTWFGTMAYNQLKVPDVEAEPIKCQVCGISVPFRDWLIVSWVGQGPPPETDFGVCNVSSWVEIVPDRWK